MSTPSDHMTIEDRLRAHFAERAANEALPGPEADAAVHQAQLGGRRPGAAGRAAGSWLGAHRRLMLAAAAVVLVVAAVAGATAARRGDDADGTVTDGPSPTEPEPDTGDEAPAATPPSSAPGVPTPPEPPSSTIGVPDAGTPAGPVVSRGIVVGGWSGSVWVPAAELTLPEREEYRLVTLDESLPTVVGTAATSSCGPAEDVATVELAGDEGELVAPVAVAGADDLRPRPVTVIDPEDPTYTDAVRGFMADKGITDDDPDITAAVRVDLDGDGLVEVLIAAEHRFDPTSMFAQRGDYQVVLLRQLVGGEVRTTEVALSYWQDTTADDVPVVSILRLAAVADLNGDGRMEVAVDSTYYEGDSVTVYEAAPGGGLTRVLENGCGV